MELKSDTLRKYQIIDSLVRLDKASLDDIHKETSIPTITLKRQIALLRREFMMDIQFVQHEKKRGRSGFYVLVDWGIISPEKFLMHFSQRNMKQRKQ